MIIDPISRAICIGVRLRREELGLTPSDLACRCGLFRKAITEIENQQIGVTQSMVLRLAEALDTTPHSLLGPYADRSWQIQRG